MTSNQKNRRIKRVYQPAELRAKAEKIVNDNLKIISHLNASQIEELVNELKVHQVELEMQNEILQRAHDELEIVRDQYADLYNNAPVGYVTSNPFGLVSRANATMAKMLKASVNELLNTNLGQWCVDKDAFYLHCRALMHKGDTHQNVIQMKKADGTIFYISIESRLMAGEGPEEQQEVRSVILDVTDRERAIEEKLQAQRYAMEQQKHALVGRIAGKMAHDFNNILSGIMGNTELALDKFPHSETAETLKLIFQLTLRGTNLTRNLVAFARDQEPRQEFFLIKEKAELVLNLLKKDLEKIAVVRQYDPDVPVLLADPGMIEHAIVNLVQNSIHATSLSAEPKIVIRTSHRNEHIIFQIEDNGCGIPKESLERIYEPAFTLKGGNDATASYKPGIKGTGYGMSNVKKYIEQHRGTISIDSEVGQGTTITMRLPVTQKGLTHQEKIEIQKDVFYSEKRILLVEDESVISKVQYEILTSPPCNHKVDVAMNGGVAIGLFDRNKYDFVSLDFKLPGKISGLDVYHYIREKDNKIPILFISGNLTFLRSMNDLMQQDPNLDHLSKPCRNKDYISTLNKLFDSQMN